VNFFVETVLKQLKESVRWYVSASVDYSACFTSSSNVVVSRQSNSVFETVVAALHDLVRQCSMLV